MKEVKIMFIDKATMIIGILCLVAWAIANLIVAFNYSFKTMVECFWKEQTIMGKICANIFYAPAWVLLGVATAVLVVLVWVLVPIYKALKWLVVEFLHPLYRKAIRFEL